ncbi:hypothetical protein SGRIM128S_08909 [Streptomyces griseomycini]
MEQDTLAEAIEAGSAEHPAFGHLDSVDASSNNTGTPGQGEAGDDGVEPPREPFALALGDQPQHGAAADGHSEDPGRPCTGPPCEREADRGRRPAQTLAPPTVRSDQPRHLLDERQPSARSVRAEEPADVQTDDHPPPRGRHIGWGPRAGAVHPVRPAPAARTLRADRRHAGLDAHRLVAHVRRQHRHVRDRREQQFLQPQRRLLHDAELSAAPRSPVVVPGRRPGGSSSRRASRNRSGDVACRWVWKAPRSTGARCRRVREAPGPLPGRRWMLLVKHAGHAADGHCGHPPVAPLRQPSDGAGSALGAMPGAPGTGIFVIERTGQQFTEAEDRRGRAPCALTPANTPAPDGDDRRAGAASRCATSPWPACPA